MTAPRLTPRDRSSTPPPVLDIRLLVLLTLTALMVWLALTNPPVAAAIALGLSVLYLLHQITR